MPARSCRASRRRRRWCVNDRAYTIRVRFPGVDARVARRHPEHAAGQRHRQDRHRSARWPRVEEIPGQTEIRRENLQRNVHGHGAARRARTSAPAWPTVQQAIADLHLPPAIRVHTAAQYEEQQKSFKDLLLVLVLAVVLVFIVLLFEFGDFAAPIGRDLRRRCSPPSACSWRCWSRGRRSTSRRSWA